MNTNDAHDDRVATAGLAENLRAARELLSEPARWTRGYYAYDEDGKQMLGTARAATCWCMLGALQAVTNIERDRDLLETAYLCDAVGVANADDLADWNDHRDRSHAEVLAAFDRAIASAESA